MSDRKPVIISEEQLEEQRQYIQQIRLMPDAPKSYHVVTYGCQMNAHDSEILAGMLRDMGMEEAVLFPAGALQRNGGGSARRRTLDCADDCHAVLLVRVPRDVYHHCRADLAGTDDDFVGLPDYMGTVFHHLPDLLQRRGLGSRLWSEQTTQNDVKE